MGDAILQLTAIVGFAEDEAIAGQLHELEHQGKVDEIVLARDDLARRRIRTRTTAGIECTVSLPRHQRLKDGAVLLLDQARAIVVRARPERWITLEAPDVGSGLELGYFAGNMHWRVRFEGQRISIGVEQDEEFYLQRLGPLMAARRIIRVGYE